MIAGERLLRLLSDPTSRFVVTPILDADEQINDSSIDIRLGPDIIVSSRAVGPASFDPSNRTEFHEALRERQQIVRRRLGDRFHLQPGEFVLARSLEYVALPEWMSAEALGRSSWGRLGLTIATATLIQPGFKGTITLELTNVGNTPIVLHIGVTVAQLVFNCIEAHPDAPRLANAAIPVRASTESPDARDPGPDTTGSEPLEAWLTSWRGRRRRDSRYDHQLEPAASRLDQDADYSWVSPLALRYVVGVVGARFSGKSAVVSYLVSRRGFRLYRFSDVIRDEAVRSGRDPGSTQVLREIGNEMREWSDDAIARLLFDRIRAEHLDPDHARAPVRIVIEGFRTPAELGAWENTGHFRTLLLEADIDTRLRRFAQGGFEPAEGATEPMPGEDAGLDAQRAWFEHWIDQAAAGGLPLGDLLEAAAAGRSKVRVENQHDGFPILEANTRSALTAIERWWRAQEIELPG